MGSDKLTLDVEMLNEVHELKEGSKYIIVVPEADNSQCKEIGKIMKHKFNLECVAINTPLKIYEVQE